MLKYLLPIFIFVFSIVSVFAEKIGDAVLVWKNPVATGGNLFTPRINIGEFSPENIETTTGTTNTGTIVETTISPYSPPMSYFQSLKKPMRTILFYEDDSLFRFVSRYRSLNDKSYAPYDLESISGAYINEAGRKSYLRVEARDALVPLAKAFEEEFGEPLTVISGYRSASYQQRLWDLGRCTSSLCAPPGYSEHQLGLAVDLFDASTEKEFDNNKRYRKYISWLKQNAHLYGWTQSYQK